MVSVIEKINRCKSHSTPIRKRSPKTGELYLDIYKHTSFLPSITKIKERIFCIQHDITTIKLCAECDTPVKFLGPSAGYRSFCSPTCSGVSSITRGKRESTNIETYGVRVPAQSKNVRSKIKDTTMKNHGVEYSQQSKIVRNKTKATNLKNHGVESYTQSVEFSDTTTRTLQSKYGINHINQRHLSPRAIKLMNDKSWLITQNHALNKMIIEIAEDLQVSVATICRKFDEFDITTKYNNTSVSKAEKDICKVLSTHGIRYETQLRNIIPPKEIDIWLPDHDLGIEYCGVYWHSDIHNRITPSYHLDKLNNMNDKGFNLITLFEDEWTFKRDIVEEKILHLCNNTTKQSVYGRKCTIVSDISRNVKASFFNNYHIQGTGDGSITYGLEYDGELVAVMTFINRVGTFELNRYATKHHVLGGFSKLLKHFTRSHQWTSIISYADRRWSTGDVYEKNGFNLTNISSPDYFYVKNGKRFHRRLFTKGELKKKFINFDSTLTEYQNCMNNNFLRIWGCGQLRYEMHNI